MNEEAKGESASIDELSSTIDSVTKQKKRYKRNKLLALIGILIIIVGLCSISLVLQGVLRPVILPVSETTVSSLIIGYFPPNTLEVGTPATFSVSLSNSEIHVTATATNQRLLQATPIPNGTPNVPLSQAFGAGYMVFAYAQLDVSPASKFDLPPLRQDSQSLDQQQPTFSWTITPKETTQAVITITITGQWKPRGTGNEIDIPLWENHKSYAVSSPQPFIVQALTTLGGELIAILPILGGIGLTIPWILDQIRKVRNKAKQSKKKRTPRARKRVNKDENSSNGTKES